MGQTFELINLTQREKISFYSLGGYKAREIAGNEICAMLVTWYLLRNQGDQIQFVGDQDPASSRLVDSIENWPDRTEEVLSEMTDAGLLGVSLAGDGSTCFMNRWNTHLGSVPMIDLTAPLGQVVTNRGESEPQD